MSDTDEHWLDPSKGDDLRNLPLPCVDHTPLLDPSAWRAAEAAAAVPLAKAALALGQLDGMLGSWSAEDRAGALARLALIEAEALSWAAGTPLSGDELACDLMDAPAGADLEALRLGRWAVRRLHGPAPLSDLRDFLGLHAVFAAPPVEGLRLTGPEFDAAAEEFTERLRALDTAHPLTQAAYGCALWRLSGLSPEGDVVESAVWAARQMARPAIALSFAPFGAGGRLVWTLGGEPQDRLTHWFTAVGQGAEEARNHMQRLSSWADRARRAAAQVKGQTAARVISTLIAAPLVSTAQVEAEAKISRDTAERMLARLQGLGLVREVTGKRRFRLWAAAHR